MSHSPPRPSPTLDRLRKLCLSLPATSEKQSWGHPNFCVADKIFASYGEYEGRPCVGFKTTKEHQAELVREPRYIVAPYVGKHGWVCQWLEQRFTWDELEAHILASYRLIAPKRLLADLDAAASSAPMVSAKPIARATSGGTMKKKRKRRRAG